MKLDCVVSFEPISILYCSMKSDGMKIRQEKEFNTLMPLKFSLDCDATAEIILVWSLAQVQLTTFRLLYVFVMSNFSQLFFFKKKKHLD